MRSLKLGCQTITWGESQSDHFPRVFAEVAAAGFAGVEIGIRHIQHTPPPELNRMLRAEGLALLGAHVGGNLEDAAQAAGERDMLGQVIDCLQQMGSDRLMYSGLKYQNDEQFHTDVEMLRRAGKRCRQAGIELLYHNHNWEFADGGRVIDALIEDTDLGFCPDIGWVMKGGCDALTLLGRLGARVGAIHFKDFASGKAEQGLVVDTVLLGEGVAPLAEAARWAGQNVPHVWMIAEQDSADRPPAEAAQHNGNYLRQVFDFGA